MSPFAEAALIATGVGTVIGAVTADGMAQAPTATAVLLWAAGVVTAVGVLWKFFHVGEILKGTRNFLKDYNGEPARPGAEARPGLPERLAKIEHHTHETKAAFPAMVVALDELQRWATENGARIDAVNDRITEHRRRNEDQAILLRKALDERNAAVDARLDHLSEDLLRAETYRASLVELGIDPERRDRPRPSGD